jgi:hypothetical protein
MTAAFRDHVLAIGADPRDTADERFRKRLLVRVAPIILPPQRAGERLDAFARAAA